MPNGGVLVTGGAATGSNNVAVCAQDCQLFNGTAWVAAGFLPVGVAFHSQVTDPASGNAVIMGGFTGDFGFNPASTQAGVHNGTAFTATRDLGGHAYLTGQASTPRAGHTCTPLPDGTFLVWGGQTPVPVNSTIATYGDGYAYVK